MWFAILYIHLMCAHIHHPNKSKPIGCIKVSKHWLEINHWHLYNKNIVYICAHREQRAGERVIVSEWVRERGGVDFERQIMPYIQKLFELMMTMMVVAVAAAAVVWHRKLLLWKSLFYLWTDRLSTFIFYICIWMCRLRLRFRLPDWRQLFLLIL